MDPNFPALAAAALIPLIVGLVWYSPAVVGRVVSSTNTAGKPALRIVFFILLGILLTVAVMPVVIHQMHVFSILAGQPQAEIDATMNPLMAKYGNVYRTFKHGAFHGTLSAIFMALPILGISAITERKRGKVVLAHLGYWVITLALVGGVVCGFGFTTP
jgi:hypothetical protein